MVRKIRLPRIPWRKPFVAGPLAIALLAAVIAPVTDHALQWWRSPAKPIEKAVVQPSIGAASSAPSQDNFPRATNSFPESTVTRTAQDEYISFLEREKERIVEVLSEKGAPGQRIIPRFVKLHDDNITAIRRGERIVPHLNARDINKLLQPFGLEYAVRRDGAAQVAATPEAQAPPSTPPVAQLPTSADFPADPPALTSQGVPFDAGSPAPSVEREEPLAAQQAEPSRDPPARDGQVPTPSAPTDLRIR